ncbi:FG-GAP-like repeat-containing protein [Streptomyces sp. NPDC053792]|uniref:FG-GAP-like repeat-containing protein n=1 Tax=Streptomyces sp. NPDC053792 TaxID=3365716 RepID=UPI0037D5AA2B
MSSRSLSVSVGVVLAVALAVPAASAAPAVVSAVSAASSVQVPFLADGGELVVAGATGFLSRSPDRTYRWTRYADGVSKVIETGEEDRVEGSVGSDTVVVAKHQWHRDSIVSFTMYDMATGAAPVTLDVADFPALCGEFGGVVGSTLLMGAYDGSALTQVEVTGGAVTSRKVTGVPVSVDTRWGSASLPGAAVVRHPDPDSPHETMVGVVDLATAGGVESYHRTIGTRRFPAWDSEYLSKGRVAWTGAVDGKAVLATAVRGDSEVEQIALGPDDTAESTGGLLGDDWFAFGATTGDATPWHTFTARSLKGGTSVPLLDHAWSATPGADGTLLVLGVTAAQGEGVYRVAVGVDGQPSAELIASTGEPNEGAAPLGYVGTTVPAVIDLDRTARPRLSWKFSSTRANLSVHLRSKVTGEQFRTVVRPASGSGTYPDGSLGLDWAGEVEDMSSMRPKSAPNGAYGWTVTATPWNGMPTVTTSGTLTVTRTPKAHDFDDNGAPDLIARDKGGYLDQISTRWDDATGRLVALPNNSSGLRGWSVYDRIESVGDIAGADSADLVARDRDGVLWLHRGRAADSPYRNGFESRVRIGGGWNAYAQLTGGSDLTGDGRADLVAVDKVGDLYLYKATGSTTAPFEPRKKIGFGWGIYNQITATGNIGGGAAGDLVARDRDGVLWLYLGRGDGTFAPRTRIGGGWNVYADVVGIGDGNKDGRPDLYARTAAGAFFYAGTGDYKVPFKARTATDAGAGTSTLGQPYNQVS